MTKAVLLIGVNQYESGLDPRQIAVQEAETIRRILRHPIIKGFSTQSMRTLKNPTQPSLAGAIGQLFSDRCRDQLLILLISAPDIKAPVGRHPASTDQAAPETSPNTNRPFVDSLAIAAGIVHDLIDQSLAEQPNISLDKHRNPTFTKGLTAKDEESVDVRAQIEGEDWIFITSSPANGSKIAPHMNYPHDSEHASPLWSRPAMVLGVSATVIFTLTLGSSYTLLQTHENQSAKQSLDQAQAMQAKSDYAGCVNAARMIPHNASTYPAAQNILKTCEIGREINALINQENYPSYIEQAKSIPALQTLLSTCRREQAKKDRLNHAQQLWHTAQQLALSSHAKLITNSFPNPVSTFST